MSLGLVADSSKLFLPQMRFHMGFSYRTFEHWKFAVKDLLHTSYEIVSAPGHAVR